MEKISDVFDARLQHPFCLIVCGPTMSGKSSFVNSLLENSHRLIYPPPDNVIWCFGIQTDKLKDESFNRYHNITPVEGIPESFDDYIKPEKTNLIILDDLMTETVSNKNVTNLFTRYCHHKNCSVILILQDIFYNGSQRKTFLRNAHYLVLFANPLDMSNIYSIGHKVMPKKIKKFLNIFEVATRSPYGYLFIDGKPMTPKVARFRTDICNTYQRVFIPNNENSTT